MAIAFDASTNKGGSTPWTSATWSHTCSGSDRILLVAAMCPPDSGSYTGNSCTYNGVSMTEINHVSVSNGTSDWHISLWYLIAPATGANNIVFNGTFTYAFAAASYTGVNQTNPVDSFAASNSGGSNVTSFAQSTTVVASNCWLVEAFRNMTGGSTAGTGTFQRQVGGYPNDTIYLYDSNGTVGTGTQTLNTNFSSNKAGAVILSMSPAAAGSTFSPHISLLGVGR